MNGNLYELIALGARYVLAAIMLLIVIRAWKITIVDARRAASLRRLSPETGVCGEFLVIRGHGRVRDGMRYPVIREGMIGASRKADIRLRSSSVHNTHAFFELTKHGLRMRANTSAKVYNAEGRSKKEMLLGDGSRITAGCIELMLILSEAVDFHPETEPTDVRDTLFDVEPAPRPEPAERVPAANTTTEHTDIFRAAPDNSGDAYRENIRPSGEIHRTAPVSAGDIFDIAEEHRETVYRAPAAGYESAQAAYDHRTYVPREPETRIFTPAERTYAPPAVPEPPTNEHLFDTPHSADLRPETDPWDDDAPAAATWDELIDTQPVKKVTVRKTRTEDPFDI